MGDPSLESGETTAPSAASAAAADAYVTSSASIDTVAALPPAGAAPRGERYRLKEEIAHGGMGAVWRATDTALDREVAVKVLQERYTSDSGAARRFADEARITAQLQHPGIPPVHDVGVLDDGRPFLAMKLIKGQTLEQLLLARPEPSTGRGRFVAAFEQVCQALAYAHAHGVIHRDLKPANVMVGAFGEVQVMDWGLAKVLASRGASVPGGQRLDDDPDATIGDTEVVSQREGDYALTRAGSVLGTPAYMPPEQAIGAVGKVDQRSDVFGLGAILAVILTGKPPFTGASAETTLLESAQGDVARCFARLGECGAEPELVALCKRCLSPKPGDRPADGDEVARAVAALREQADERARRAELERVRAEGERARAEAEAREQHRRRRVQVGLLAAVGALLLGIGAFTFWYSARLGRNAEAVGTLLEQCEQALLSGDAERAELALEAARKRATEGGTARLADRMAGLGRDLELLRELDDVDRFRWTWVENKFPERAVVAARFRTALARFAMFPDSEGADTAAARASGSAVHDRLVAVLDLLLRVEKSAAVRATLQVLDGNPYRDGVRDAVIAGNVANLIALANREEALQQPPGFAAFMGEEDNVPVERRRRLLQSAAARRPGDLSLLMALAGSYIVDHQERTDEWLRWCQAAVAVAPNNGAARTNLGQVLYQRRDLTGAEAEFRAAIRIGPRQAVAHNNLGTVLSRKKDSSGAEAEYREAIRLDPRLALARVNLGTVLYIRRDFVGAEAAYREAIRVGPKYAPAHDGLGNSLRARGDLAGAETAFRRALRLDRKLAAAHNGLGNVLFANNDLTGAEASFREAIRVEPGLAHAHVGLGQVLDARGNTTDAEAAFRKAILLDPKFAAAHDGLGYVLTEKRDLTGAEAALREAIRLDPRLAAAHNHLGNVLREKNDLSGAEGAFREATRVDPRFAKAYNNLGGILRLKKDLTGAEAAFREAIRLDPRLTMVHDNLGSVLYEKNDLIGAEAAFREEIRVNPTSASPHDGLGLVLVQKGDLDGAVAAFKRALRIDPKFSSSLVSLPRAEAMRRLLPRLPAVLAGKDVPKSPAEFCDFARLCTLRFQQKNAAAARLFDKAFAADAKLADDLVAGSRYEAACCAALAARGEGADAPTGPAERAALRGKVLAWLRADLALHEKRAASKDAADRKTTAATMSQWLAETDLSGLRDPKALASLPADERKKWQQLWAEVEAIEKTDRR
jgi:tetratricopeptide (TPR) repeat protein